MSTAPKENAEGLALRAKPKPVTRLNRKALLIFATGLSTAIVLATAWSLKKPGQRVPENQTPSNTEHLKKPDGLDALPKDYTQLHTAPLLGAPIGEFGRPVLRAEREAGIDLAPPEANFRPNADDNALRSARLREEEAVKQAMTSKVFFSLSQRTAKDGGTVPKDGTVPKASDGPSRSGTVQDENAPPAPQILAGTLIAAALVTGINSDLPGQIIATVTENVFDSVTGRILLIPQGSRLLGRYDSQVAYGQRRVMLIWNRLIRPDGSSIEMNGLPGVDTAGQAGLEDRVDWHWGRIFKGAALSTLIGVGAELAAPDRGDNDGGIIVAGRESVQETVNEVGQQITRRNLDIRPTLTIRPGFQVRVMVNQDLRLEPFEAPHQQERRS